MPQDWEINIEKFDGFVPGFWKNTNPSFGNKGHASNMINIDLIDPSVLTQGPGLSTLTNGAQDAAVTTIIKGIMKTSIDGSYSFCTGGNKFYKFSSTSVLNSGIWPHTIDKATVTSEDGEDVCYYNGYYFYSYNHSGAAGDIGRYDGATTFDDDYMSTVPTDAIALQGGTGIVHQMIVAGDGKMYITNGRYIASYDGTTFVDQALDFPVGYVVTSIAFESNRIFALVRNTPDTTSYAESSIYRWDTYSSSWEYQIRIPGQAGAIFTKNGIIYLWYYDVTSTGGFKLACVNGNQIRDLASYTGSLPSYNQVIDKENYIMWVSNSRDGTQTSNAEIWAWGATENSLATKLFQYADAGFAQAGGITNVFGNLLIASTYTNMATTYYKLVQLYHYDKNCTWNSILFDVNSAKKTSFIDRIVVLTEPLSTGAACVMTLSTNYGVNTITTPTAIAYDSANPNKTRWVIERNGAPVESFRINLNWATGSTTNPVKIRKILISGYYQTNQ